MRTEYDSQSVWPEISMVLQDGADVHCSLPWCGRSLSGSVRSVSLVTAKQYGGTDSVLAAVRNWRFCRSVCRACPKTRSDGRLCWRHDKRNAPASPPLSTLRFDRLSVCAEAEVADALQALGIRLGTGHVGLD